MNQILVIGTNNHLGQQVIDRLLKDNYHIQILSAESNYVSATESITILPIDITKANSVKPEDLSGIERVIFCLEDTPDSPNENNFGNTIYTSDRLEHLVKTIAHLVNNNLEKTLFDFSDPNSENNSNWNAVNDVVMGGVSQSGFHHSDRQAIFSGHVSTDNNGGFASVRTPNFEPPLDLADYEGIELKVKGDGKRYKFITRCEGKWDGISYNHSFDTVYDFPITVKIPFDQLSPVFRAKTVPEAGSFDSSKVYALQLMLSKFEYDGGLNPKFEPGKFTLAIESIKAYGGSVTPQLLVVNSGVETFIEEMIHHTKLPLIMVRNSANSQMLTDRLFTPQDKNSISDNTGINPLIKLAIKSLKSLESI